MGVNRWLYESFGAGQVSEQYAARPSTPECKGGLRLAKNARITPDGSVTQAPGSDLFVSAFGETKVVPYIQGNEEYMLVILDDHAGAPVQRGIWLFGKDGNDEWDATPISLWSKPDIDTRPYVTHGAFQGNDQFDSFPHPWTDEEILELTYVQHEDDLFILHNNHPPVQIRKEKNELGGLDYWFCSYYPFKDGGGEIGTKNRETTVTLTGTGANQGPDINGRATLTSSRPLFTQNMEERDTINYSHTSPNGNISVPMGAIFRAGDVKNNTTQNNLGWGDFFMVEEVVSRTEANVVSVIDRASSTSEYGDPSVWAGPWFRTEETVSIGAGFNTAATPALSTMSFNADMADIDLDPYDDIGVIIEGGRARPNSGFVLFAAYHESTDQGLFINIGRGNAGATWDSLTAYIWRPENPKKMAIIQNEAEKIETSVDLSWVTFPDLNALPDDHEILYENLRWKGYSTSDLNVGGPVFVGGGMFRPISRATWVNGTDTELTGRYEGYWETLPTALGPIHGWGWGPSKGAGFPDVGVVHQRRLVLGGYKVPGAALTISSTGNPLEMNALGFSGFAEGPMNFRLSEAREERVRVLESFGSLFISTDYGEYQLEGTPLSALSISVSKISSYGSRNTGTARVGENVLWGTTDGRGLRETRRDFNTSGFLSPDLMASTSVLRDNEYIEQVVQMSGRETQIFIRTSLGRLILLSHHEERGVKGFTYVDRPDLLEDLVVIRDDDAARSQTVWGVWRNTTTERRVIERFDLDVVGFRRWYPNPSAGEVTVNEITVPNELAGYNVQVIVNGQYGGLYNASGPLIDISALGLTSTPAPTEVQLILPCNLDVGLHVVPFMTAEGPTAAKKFMVKMVNVFTRNSYGGTVEGMQVQQLPTMTALSPFTGWQAIPGSGGSPGINPVVNVLTAEPFRFELNSVLLDGTQQTS